MFGLPLSPGPPMQGWSAAQIRGHRRAMLHVARREHRSRQPIPPYRGPEPTEVFYVNPEDEKQILNTGTSWGIVEGCPDPMPLVFGEDDTLYMYCNTCPALILLCRGTRIVRCPNCRNKMADRTPRTRWERLSDRVGRECCVM